MRAQDTERSSDLPKVTEQVCGLTHPSKHRVLLAGLFSEVEKGRGGTIGVGPLFEGTLYVMKGWVGEQGGHHPEQKQQ